MPRFLKNIIRSDKPKADSQAAIAKIKIAKTWPTTLFIKTDKITKIKVKQRSITSIDKSILIKLRTPLTIEAKVKKKEKIVKNNGLKKRSKIIY